MHARPVERHRGELPRAATCLRRRVGLLVLGLLALLVGTAAAPAAANAGILITSGPSGVTEDDDAVFTFVLTDDEEADDDDDGESKGKDKPKKVKLECRLDDGKWK